MKNTRKGVKAMVLVYQPELTYSVWQDFISRHTTIDGLENALRKGVRNGEWVGWRLITITKEIIGNS